MSTRFAIPACRFTKAQLVAFAACLILPLIPPTRGAAQTQNSTGQQNMPDQDMPDQATKPPRKSTEKEPPPPANPLVKYNPENHSGNDSQDYNKDGTRKQNARQKPAKYGDYQQNPFDSRAMQHPHKLPVFGMDYFAPAREYIQARRAYLLYQYPYLQSRTGRGSRSPMRSGTLPNGRTSRTGGTNTPATRRANAPYEQDQNIGDNTDQSLENQPDSRNSSDNGATANGEIGLGARRSDTGDLSADDNGSDGGRMSQRPDDQTEGDGSAQDDQPPSGVRQRAPINPDSYQGTDNGSADTTGAEDTTGTYDSTGTLSAAEIRRRENIHRSLLGIPPLPDDGLYSNETRGSYSSANLNGLSTRNQRSRLNQDGYPDYYGGYYDDGYYNDRYYNRREQPLDVFSGAVASPLEQMVHNVTASVPASYQLSGGDRVVVRYQNPALSPRELTSTVDTQGNLPLGEFGHVNVAGQTLAQAEKTVRARLSHYYKNLDVSISMKELRTITVIVSGKVYAPGSYTVPAVMTAFNVLYAAGGPTEDGSLRSIEIRRQGRPLTLDFYKMIAMSAPKSGAKSDGYQPDISLQSGDVIYVPGSYKRICLQGEVRNPAQYDLKEGETLQDALDYAGGVKASGVSHSVQVTTLDPGNARIIKTVDLKDTTTVSKTALYDGDVVNILTVRPIVENKVTIAGAVTQPSDYALTPGMRVKDLLTDALNPLPEAYLGRADLYRWNSDGTTTAIQIDLAKALEGDPQANIPLARWDKLEVFSRQDASFIGTRKLEARGDVLRPGTYEFSAGMHLSDLFLKAGGTLPDAEMVVVEHQHGDGTKKLEHQSVADIIHNNKDADIALEDNDIVAVYPIGATQFIPDHKVTIRGEVTGPGVYDRGEGEHLSDLLKYAGGFLPDAGSSVIIAHARRPDGSADTGQQVVTVAFDSQHRCAPQDDVLLQDGDEVLVQGQGGFEDKPRLAWIKGEVNKPGYYPIKPTTRVSDLITMAGGLRKEAFPEGAQFNRDPKMMASSEQRDLARIISDLSDLYNESAYKRELAKSDLERIKASGNASQPSSVLPIGAPQVPVENPAAAALALELSKHDLVSKPRVLSDQDLAPNGNIAINLPEALRKPGGNEDILLVDGDTITVPETPTTVQVVGAVVNPRGVKYQSGESLNFYVEATGGFAPDAARDHIVVIHAGGGLTPANKVRTLRPGDVIFVPTRVLAEKLTTGGNGSNIGSIFNSLVGSAILYRLATGAFGL